jgi:electron transfer flavoprotein beta subunit
VNLFVWLKQVPDTETKITVKGDGASIEKGSVKWVVNPYDEFAIEEALKTKEKLKAGTVTAVAFGPDRVVEALRTAVAMGCDEAVHVVGPEDADSFTAAEAVAGYLKTASPSVVFLGKEAIDDGQAAEVGLVAELLDLPSASVVTKIDWGADGKSVTVERDVEGGTKHVVALPLPAVLGLDKGINTPRYAPLPGIMRAKKKEIKKVTPTAGTAPTVDSGYQLPPERPPGKRISGDAAAQAHELVRLLREEAKVL